MSARASEGAGARNRRYAAAALNRHGTWHWPIEAAAIMPRMPTEIEALATARKGLSAWCMFDNTAASQASGNALSLMARVDESAISSSQRR